MRRILCFLYLELCPIDCKINFYLAYFSEIRWIFDNLMNKTKAAWQKLQIHRWIKRDWIEALTKHCRRLNRADQSHWDGDLQKNQRIAHKLDILRKQCVKNVKGWGQNAKLGPHSAIWGKLGTALQAYTLNPCTKFPPNPTSRKVNT